MILVGVFAVRAKTLEPCCAGRRALASLATAPARELSAILGKRALFRLENGRAMFTGCPLSELGETIGQGFEDHIKIFRHQTFVTIFEKY